jgi:hypothetical protein
MAMTQTRNPQKKQLAAQKRIGAPRHTTFGFPVPRKGGEILAGCSTEKVSANHAIDKNPPRIRRRSSFSTEPGNQGRYTEIA